jgi:hypothetical protein
MTTARAARALNGLGRSSTPSWDRPSAATSGARDRDALDDAVSRLAARCGGWVLLERRGIVLSHAAGAVPCPEAAAAALLQRTIAPLHHAVAWRRDEPGTGTLAGQPVKVQRLAPEVHAWAIGATDAPQLEALREFVPQEAPPAYDSVVARLIEPGGDGTGAAPVVQLLALDAKDPEAVARRLVAAFAGAGARVHCCGTHVLVAIGVADDAMSVLLKAGRADVRAVGVAVVPAHVPDWAATYRFAVAASSYARSRDTPVAYAADPEVAAQLITEAAASAAAALAEELRYAPMVKLREYDRRHRTDLSATVAAWCRSGFDVASTAAALHVHPNTLRYRLRRAGQVADIELTCPRQLLALQILAPQLPVRPTPVDAAAG